MHLSIRLSRISSNFAEREGVGFQNDNRVSKVNKTIVDQNVLEESL